VQGAAVAAAAAVNWADSQAAAAAVHALTAGTDSIFFNMLVPLFQVPCGSYEVELYSARGMDFTSTITDITNLSQLISTF